MQLYTSIANSNSKIWIHNFNGRDVAEMVRILGLQTACEKLFPKVLSVCSFSAADDLSIFPNLSRLFTSDCIIRHIPPELDKKVKEIFINLRHLPSNVNELPRRLTSLFLVIEDQMNIAMDCVRAFDSLSQACLQLRILILRFNARARTVKRKERHENEVQNYATLNKFPSKL